ncbi:kinesin-domain-containing protein [Cristinia sonorae]|uniref:Kinesin-domain-containing protein n=1 Tax=Cristinia sonorae TaxID=1940300 RepID=A0A8K0UZ05_9AGAR|nr:kinesin-domain-containing protein [Cristinia sonorae]
MAEHGEGNIKVVVRCRPLNSREIARGAKCLVRMEGNQTILDPPEPGSSGAQASAGRATERKTMNFAFDKSYWSAGSRDEPNYCSQQTLYDDLGKELLDHGFAGFNACILAYGQTGSGKSYSMMGYGADKGIIPLTCSELFVRVAEKTAADPDVNFTVEVSYIEIYNEKVRDLLNPKNTGNLRVREHPSLGPYVEDLSKLVVRSYDEMMTLMDEGNKARTVAATNMNETSSRSHAVFTLLLTMKRHDKDTNLDTEKVSRISLVDLAGSERANSTGATGQRLKEGANINKSLTTLGKVIASLAAASQAEGKKGKKGKADEFVPYRDSVLTWLLKDSLGGNSKTAMIAAISPADVQYEETLSTLRYADQAKKIKNKAVINEDPNAKLVRELKEELELLRARVSGSTSEAVYDPKIPAAQQKVTYQAKDGSLKTVTKAELQEQLEAGEKLMQGLNETWEEKMKRTQEVQLQREQALEELGISVEKNNVGVHTPKRMPHLVNLNEDPLMSECLIYQLKPGRTMIGRLDSMKPASIRLSGESILEEHCYFDNLDGKVTLHALPDAVTFLNGRQITPEQVYKLRSGYRIILGEHHVFRFNNPEEVRRQRDRAMARSSLSISRTAADIASEAEDGTRPSSPTSSVDMADVDWNFAKREAAFARLGLDPALDQLPDDDLNKLFEKVTRVKTLRDNNSRRPESSLSQADDIWSENGRPLPSDGVTDDTSVDASHNSPDVVGSLKDVQSQLETQRAEFEQRLQAVSELSEAEDLKAEKAQMEHQLKLVQTHIKRLLEARARGDNDVEVEHFEPQIYSAKQMRLIRRVLDKWRANRSFSMAEVVLSNAVLLKEANIISNELKKAVTYNFTIASGGALASPKSALETLVALDQFGDVVDPVLSSASQPSAAIKVIDQRHCAIYLWSLDRLQQKLQKMRNLTAFIDRPTYAQHFSEDEPFYDTPAPEYSFIGNSLVSLAPLARRLSSTTTVPIFCRYTSEAIGSCRIELKITKVVQSTKQLSNAAPPSKFASPAAVSVPPGSKLVFFVSVDSVKGLSHHDFSAVHLQLRLSSLTGPHSTTEEVYPSSIIDMDVASLSDLKFRRSFSLVITNKVLVHLRQGYVPVEFYARLRPTYLERMERWDEMRDQRHAKRNSPSPRATPSLSMRRSETEFVTEQVHDVVAWLQICELSPDGSYTGVPVVSRSHLDPGCFSLHQGLQRRIILSLTCNSGRQLPWTEMTRIRVGNIRLLDDKGRMHDSSSKALVTLPLLQEQPVIYKADGTGNLTAQAVWDSSVHDCTLLNRVTHPQHRVFVQVDFTVAVEICADPVHFSMDAALTIGSRDARPPSRLLTFIGATRVLPKVSTVFNVRLTPPLTRSPKDLWRIDTAEKYVRGEEMLGSWRPRGISVVEDYTKLVTMERRAADVQATRVVLAGSTVSRSTQADANVWASEEILRKALDLWQKRFGDCGELKLSQEPAESEDSSSEGRLPGSPSSESLKLLSHAHVVPRSHGSTKHGHLMILIDAIENIWERRYFVLRRPYLHMYAHSDEVEEVAVINLNGVNLERQEHMEALLGKRFTFTLFTSTNSYALSATNEKELQSWISKLDPTRLAM